MTMSFRATLFALGLLFLQPAASELTCDAERHLPLLPADPSACEALDAVIRDPSGLPLDAYEEKLGDYLRAFCHRRTEAGWQRDKFVRDTGPYTATLQDGEWVGSYHGTHAPVVIWYSPEMLDWLRTYRSGEAARKDPPPIPDGAVLVKEMFPAPAAA